MNSVSSAWAAGPPGENSSSTEFIKLERQLAELTEKNKELRGARAAATIRALELQVRKKYASELSRVVEDETYYRREAARLVKLTAELGAREPVVARAEAELVRVAALYSAAQLSETAAAAASQTQLQDEIETLEWELRYKAEDLETKKRELATVNDGLGLETLECALADVVTLPQDMSHGELWASGARVNAAAGRQKLSECPQKERERLSRRDGYQRRFRSHLAARPGCSLEATQYLSMGSRVEEYKTRSFADTARSQWLWDIDN